MYTYDKEMYEAGRMQAQTVAAPNEEKIELIRVYSATTHCKKHKQFRQKCGKISARGTAKTA